MGDPKKKKKDEKKKTKFKLGDEALRKDIKKMLGLKKSDLLTSTDPISCKEVCFRHDIAPICRQHDVLQQSSKNNGFGCQSKNCGVIKSLIDNCKLDNQYAIDMKSLKLSLDKKNAPMGALVIAIYYKKSLTASHTIKGLLKFAANSIKKCTQPGTRISDFNDFQQFSQ